MKAFKSARRISLATILVLFGFALGALCFREAAVRTLSPTAPLVMRVAPGDPDVVLGRAVLQLADKVSTNDRLDQNTLAVTQQAATLAPLDARPYLIFGYQQLLDGQLLQAVSTLEMSQRLDPRNRLTHLLLLDRYLRDERYGDAAEQFSVLARLVGQAQGPIASAVAEMTQIPETRDAVVRTLRTDPNLELAVLRVLASSQASPAEIFALASPEAKRRAAHNESWGPVLVARLVDQTRYLEAREVWQRIYRIPDNQISSPIFNASFRQNVAAPPFDWNLNESSMGNAAVRDGSLLIDYYGRENGSLVSQLLTLSPGPYSFGFTVEESKAADGPSLFWSLRCLSADTASPRHEIFRMQIAGTGRAYKVANAFTVPTNCPAQQLELTGQADEFPATISVILRGIDMRAGSGPRQ